jgi:NAD(P)-dependent dehydrogenase (short-subunit alcohol dehydrogenase family)
MLYNNQLAIITGGGSGLGAATAVALSKQGMRIAVLDVNIAAAQTVAKQIDGVAIECDVTSESSVLNAFEQAQRSGVVRVVVNCAGIAPAERIVGKQGAMPLDAFTQVININLIGTFNVMRVAAENMSHAETLDAVGERGVIINTASVAAFEGQIGQAAYSASKGGVAAMTLPAARELARFGIRVVTIAPGIFATPMMQAMPQEVQDSLAASIPFPARMGQPEEYGKLALHIIENQMLNGNVIRLDGAIRMPPK